MKNGRRVINATARALGKPTTETRRTQRIQKGLLKFFSVLSVSPLVDLALFDPDVTTTEVSHARILHANGVEGGRGGAARRRSAHRRGDRFRGARDRQRAQSARAASRPDGPRRDDRHYPGRRVAELVAAGRLHAVRDARALPDVRGAILQARLPTVVYGAADGKAGAVQSLFRLLSDARLNHRCHLVPGVLAEPCGAILTQFFQQQRAAGKK